MNGVLDDLLSEAQRVLRDGYHDHLSEAVATVRNRFTLPGRRSAPLIGTWPAECPQRAFVDGVAWAYVQVTHGTLFPSERDDAEAEAISRYGDPHEQESNMAKKKPAKSTLKPVATPKHPSTGGRGPRVPKGRPVKSKAIR